MEFGTLSTVMSTQVLLAVFVRPGLHRPLSRRTRHIVWFS